MTEPIKMENWRVFLILMTDKKDSRIYGSFHTNIVRGNNNMRTFSANSEIFSNFINKI